MRRVLALAVTVSILLIAPSAHAAAVPFLGYPEAGKQIGKLLHTDDDPAVVGGSLDATCERLARNRVFCDFTYRDVKRTEWVGYGKVSQNRQHHYNVNLLNWSYGR